MRKLFIFLLGCLIGVFGVQGQSNVPTGATGPAAATAKRTPASYVMTPLAYKRVYSPAKPVSDSSQVNLTASAVDIGVVTDYFDSYGRPVQTVSRQTSAAQSDNVTSVTYDEFGNASTQYLPFVPQSGNTNDGLFKTNAFSLDSAFYKGIFPNEQINYGQEYVDGSPLNIRTKATAPGNSWTGAGVGVTYTHRTNTAADSVHLWTIAVSTEDDVPTTSANYQPGTLLITGEIDERGDSVLKYVDEIGRTILTKAQILASPSSGHYGWLCTYYIYDEMNHLRLVIPPKAVDALNNSTINWNLAGNPTINDGLCYEYFYDSRGRITMKRMPGKGKSYAVYDVWDRRVFIQDSALRLKNQWIGVIYDGQGRVSISGMLNDSISRASLQVQVTSQTGASTTSTIITDSLSVSNLTLNNNPTNGDWRATNSINLASGFGVSNGYSFSGTIAAGMNGKSTVVVTGSPLPAGMTFTILQVLYYDDYNWLNGISNSSLGGNLTTDNINGTYFNQSYNSSPYYPQPITASIRTRGRLTGVKKAILGTSNYLYSVNIYDDYGRAIQTKMTNYSGGTDIVTMQYSWDGRVINSLLAHQKLGANTQKHLLQTAFTYDQSGRLLTTTQNLDGTLSRTINSNTYNELGQLQKKVVGVSMETQNYAYNIRGWLLSINGSYVGTSGSTSNYFGETLAYDYGFTNSLLNGSIAGTTWKAAGDGISRAYGYSYDMVNRLKVADFSQQNGASWSKNQVDFSVDGINYDAGGNILSMRQRGLKLGSSATIDSLDYQYFTNSNQLQKVSDGITDMSPLGDFKDTTVSGNDYTYDANGNTTMDLNRHLCSSTGGQGSVYNFLNKPDSIGINGKAGIHYYYDATGSQLYKQINDYTPGATPATKNYLYSNGFVYLNDTLQYVLQEEGRIRYAKKVNSATGAIYYVYEYDYFIKDHLGNIRTILTEGKDTSSYAATMESKDSAVVSALFSNVYTPVNTVYVKPSGFDSDTSNHFVARLNASSGVNITTGPSIVLKVMAGDQVQMSTYAYYTTPVQPPPSGVNLLNSILPLLAGGVISNGEGHLLSGDLTNLTNTLNPNVAQFLNNRGYDSTKPKAYLNWILFDDQFNYIASNSGVQQVQSGGTKQVLSAPTQTMSKNGYLYVYVSNESAQDVYFDNLTVKDVTGPLAQEQGYYPFGLQMAGISDKKLLAATNPYKFDGGTEYEEDYGLDYYNTMYRKYDPQIGRFCGVDALSEEAIDQSPYHFASNNPLSLSDPSGAMSQPTLLSLPTLLSGTAKIALQNFENFESNADSYYDMGTGSYTGDGTTSDVDEIGGAYGNFWTGVLKTVNAALAANRGENPNTSLSYIDGQLASINIFYNYTDPNTGLPTATVLKSKVQSSDGGQGGTDPYSSFINSQLASSESSSYGSMDDALYAPIKYHYYAKVVKEKESNEIVYVVMVPTIAEPMITTYIDGNGRTVLRVLTVWPNTNYTNWELLSPMSALLNWSAVITARYSYTDGSEAWTRTWTKTYSEVHTVKPK